MPEAVQAVAAAREDKDIRENAPLEAAREHQERLKSRIDELEYQIAHAVVREQQATGPSQAGQPGSQWSRSMIAAASWGRPESTLWWERRKRMRRRGRISVESPLGRGLLDQPADRQIEIQAPSGRKRFRLLAVQG